MPHKKVVRGLIALGTVLIVLAIFAVWADRQALNTDEWVDTSGKLLEDEEVKSALSGYLVNELYANVDVQARLEQRLPPRLDPVAGPLAGALRQAATAAAERAFESIGLEDWRANFDLNLVGGVLLVVSRLR